MQKSTLLTLKLALFKMSASAKRLLPMCEKLHRYHKVKVLWTKLSNVDRCLNNSIRSISTSCARQDESMRANTEMSWVRRILHGSGPSADIDEAALEDEVVEVEPRYMEILQEAQSDFITRPKTRRRSYSPPPDIEDALEEITLQMTVDTDPATWKDVSLGDSRLKYQILSRCAETFKHAVPNFQLKTMDTVADVLRFYQTEVKDATIFDELSTQDLPPNLRIQWDYSNDSKLEVYEDYLEYVKKKGKKVPDWPFRPS